MKGVFLRQDIPSTEVFSSVGVAPETLGVGEASCLDLVSMVLCKAAAEEEGNLLKHIWLTMYRGHPHFFVLHIGDHLLVNTSMEATSGMRLNLRALSFCQNWPARPIGLQRKCNNLKEHLHDNPSHSSGGLYIILEEC